MSCLLQAGLHALERLVALLVLLSALPWVLLAVIGITWTTGDWPEAIADQVVTSDGRVARSLRWRTTGSGSGSFHMIGRWMRRFRIDELPAFWSAACGELPLRDVMRDFWRA